MAAEDIVRRIQQPDPSQRLGTAAALLTPLLMGMAPVFGRLSLETGIDSITLAAVRTCLAALLLWIVFLVFARRYIYIFPAGVFFTLVVGAVNGLGSLMYYNGLFLLNNASITQLLNMMYVIFAMLFTRVYGQHISLLSVVRALMAMAAVYLLTMAGRAPGTVQLIGVGLMLVSAVLYALHVVLSQRVMYEMPAPTMTLYSLTWMGVTVLMARIVYGAFYPLSFGPALSIGWAYITGLTLVTAFSRLTLFTGVRNIGAVQTILFNVAEIAVTLLIAFLWLGERMSSIQWVGVAILLASVLLSGLDTDIRDDVYRPVPPRPSPLAGLPPDVRKELESIMGPASAVPGGFAPPEPRRYQSGGGKSQEAKSGSGQQSA